MNTIRYGTSVGPSGVNGEGAPPHLGGRAWDDADPDRIVQCPYDKNHQIRASRFPYHVLKCRKNHPKLASELKTCPFNARHLIPKHEFSHHVANCEDKKPLTTEGHVEILEKFQVPLNSWTNPSPIEDWETETDDSADLFVWGKSQQSPIIDPKQARTDIYHEFYDQFIRWSSGTANSTMASLTCPLWMKIPGKALAYLKTSCLVKFPV